MHNVIPFIIASTLMIHTVLVVSGRIPNWGLRSAILSVFTYLTFTQQLCQNLLLITIEQFDLFDYTKTSIKSVNSLVHHINNGEGNPNGIGGKPSPAGGGGAASGGGSSGGNPSDANPHSAQDADFRNRASKLKANFQASLEKLKESTILRRQEASIQAPKSPEIMAANASLERHSLAADIAKAKIEAAISPQEAIEYTAANAADVAHHKAITEANLRNWIATHPVSNTDLHNALNNALTSGHPDRIQVAKDMIAIEDLRGEYAVAVAFRTDVDLHF